MDPNVIKNKIKRSQVLSAQRAAKSKAKRARVATRDSEAAALGAAAPPRAAPKTIESTRTADETTVAPGDEEVAGDEAEDEFAAIFSGELQPKIMVTTQQAPSAEVFPVIAGLMSLIPQAFYYRRQHFALRKIAGWAAEKNFTHLLVLVEKARRVHTLLVMRLGGGPTACFRFSSSMLSRDIANHGTPTAHIPEIILNNFSTRLGRRFGRLLGSLYPHAPEFRGRQVVTFHNQRDFIFLRHHRYAFNEAGDGARLQELGPRFTLKPRWLLAGEFDPTQGEYEFLHKRSLDLTRRTFLL